MSSISLVLLVAGSGCAVWPGGSRPAAATAAAPAVQDCTNVSVGSPTQFACGGKVYTAYKLMQLREAQAQPPRP
jgi:hypothetical protein